MISAERRRQILERLNTYDVGPSPHDHRIMEEAEREKSDGLERPQISSGEMPKVVPEVSSGEISEAEMETIKE